MKNSWLTYSQTLLEKVSFDRKLLLKELKKALKNLNPTEKKELFQWSKTKFGVSFLELKNVKLPT
jgi:hypothetical protein